MPRFRLNLVSCALLWAIYGSATYAQTSYELTDEGFEAIAVPEPGTPAAELAAVKGLIAEGQSKEAFKQVDQWLKDNPGDPLRVEAVLLRADAQFTAGDFYASLFDYEEVITRYPASEQFWTALEREYEIGVLYTTGFKRKFLGVRWLPAEGEGAELFIRIQERAPGSPLGEKASLALADHYFRAGEMSLATEAYDLFLLNYPDSQQRQWALLRLIQASLARFKGPEFDGTGLIDAEERLRQFRDEYPAAADRIGTEALLVRIRESLARRDLASAAWYQRTGENVSAVLLYRRLIEDYPDTSAARDGIAQLEKLGEAPVAAPGTTPGTTPDTSAGANP